MASRSRKPRYNVQRMEADRLAKGWTLSKLARESEQSPSNVSRFMRREWQSPKAAKKIAIALGHPLDRYVDEAKAS